MKPRRRPKDAFLLLAICGAVGAFIDILLHFTQLFPRFTLSIRTTAIITLIGAGLMLASCLAAFNTAALFMGLGIAGMAVFSLITGKEVD